MLHSTILLVIIIIIFLAKLYPTSVAWGLTFAWAFVHPIISYCIISYYITLYNIKFARSGDLGHSGVSTTTIISSSSIVSSSSSSSTTTTTTATTATTTNDNNNNDSPSPMV